MTRSQRETSLQVLAKSMELPEAVIPRYVDNRPPSPIFPVDEKVIEAQQMTADLFYANQLLPKQLEVKSAVWTESD